MNREITAKIEENRRNYDQGYRPRTSYTVPKKVRFIDQEPGKKKRGRPTALKLTYKQYQMLIDIASAHCQRVRNSMAGAMPAFMVRDLSAWSDLIRTLEEKRDEIRNPIIEEEEV